MKFSKSYQNYFLKEIAQFEPEISRVLSLVFVTIKLPDIVYY